MKNLETLIQELCPNGVEFVKLGEVMDIYRGASPRPIQKYLTTEKNGVNWIKIGDVEDNAKYIISTKEKITQEGAAKSRFLHKGDLILSNSMSFGRPYILAIDGCIHDGWISMSGYDGKLLPDFLYHLLRSYNIQKYWRQKASSGTVSNLNADIVRKTEIPLPPIEVQTEIVRILDKFTSLEVELEAELEAELDCRKRQYEYYRDKLLSFDNVGGQEVEWKKMSEVFDMKNGYTPSKAKAEYWEGGTIPWFRMEDIRENGRILSDSIQHITMVGVKKGKLFPANSFILATTATIGEHALVISDSLANQQFTNLTVRKSLSDRLLIKFVFHYMFIVDEWCKKNINVSGFASVDMNKFKKLEFPIPSLEEQHRIVSILDRFESLTTSLQSGLPAEITARRQQYEHYRDKLLTFKRKGAV